MRSNPPPYSEKKKKEGGGGWRAAYDVCVLCPPGTPALGTVEWHCTVRLSEASMRIWVAYDLGSSTWQAEGFHATLLCQTTRAAPC